MLIVSGRDRVSRPDVGHDGEDAQVFGAALPELQDQSRRALQRAVLVGAMERVVRDARARRAQRRNAARASGHVAGLAGDAGLRVLRPLPLPERVADEDPVLVFVLVAASAEGGFREVLAVLRGVVLHGHGIAYRT